MKAYKHLVKFSLNRSCTVSVWDGEEWQVKRSCSFKAIIAAIESVEEAELIIRDNQGEKMGWVRVSAFGLGDAETVVDNTITEFMNSWDAAYKPTISLA